MYRNVKPFISPRKRFFFLPFAFFFFPFVIAAQPHALTDSATISLITVSPGNELYTTFGHSAFRVVDKSQNLDRIYNYGTFNFDEPGFYLNFCRGKLDYLLSAYRYKWAEETYIDEQRSIFQQQLNVTPEMRDYLFQFLEWNHLPENRRYRYDFFFDNCATRIRDVFERTLGDDVRLYENPDRHMTFREYIDLYLTGLPFSDYGIDLALGAKTDNPASAHEAMFLPDYLFEAVENGEIRVNGEWQPLVAQFDTLFWTEISEQPKTALPWMTIILWLVFAFAGWATFRAYQEKQSPKISRIDYGLFALNGLMGLVMLLLWFATDHTTTVNNWNLIWAWPTNLIVAGLFFVPNMREQLRVYFMVFAGVLVLSLAGWAFLPQDLHEANIPFILALVLRCWWLSR